MSSRIVAALLAASTALAGCSTVNKAVEGAKEDWSRMTSSTPEQTGDQQARITPPIADAAVNPAAAPAAKPAEKSVVHPRLEQAVAEYGAANRTSKGQPDPVSFNSAKCSTDLLLAKGPAVPLNRNNPQAVTKQAENAGWGAVGGAAARLPGPLGNAAGRVVQTTRDTQGAQADATQRLCARFGQANVQYLQADNIADPKRREAAFTTLDRNLAANFVRQVAAADSSTRAMLNRGTDQMIEGAARDVLNKIKSPGAGGVVGDLIHKIPGLK